jgi:hypothetical protein
MNGLNAVAFFAAAALPGWGNGTDGGAAIAGAFTSSLGTGGASGSFGTPGGESATAVTTAPVTQTGRS